MADCTHFKRKESQNSARLLNCTAWKSALIGTMCRYYTIIYYYRKIVPSRRKERLLLHGLKGTFFVANLKDVIFIRPSMSYSHRNLDAQWPAANCISF